MLCMPITATNEACVKLSHFIRFQPALSAWHIPPVITENVTNSQQKRPQQSLRAFIYLSVEFPLVKDFQLLWLLTVPSTQWAIHGNPTLAHNALYNLSSHGSDWWCLSKSEKPQGSVITLAPPCGTDTFAIKLLLSKTYKYQKMQDKFIFKTREALGTPSLGVFKASLNEALSTLV